MTTSTIGLTGIFNVQRGPSPQELLDDAIHALDRNDHARANACIRQLPPDITTQIFRLTWEAHGRPMDMGACFGEDAFLGNNGRSCDAQLKKAILEHVIGERSNALMQVISEQSHPVVIQPVVIHSGGSSQSRNVLASTGSRILRALTSLTQPQGTFQPLSRAERLVIQIQAANTSLPNALVRIVAIYTGIIERFGTEEWLHYFRVNPGQEPELPDDFYAFWDGPDPINPAQRVCDTHLPPVLRPQFVTLPATDGLQPYNVSLLGRLVKNPQKGERQSQFETGFERGLPDETPPEPAAWLVMRRGVIGRNQRFSALTEPLFDLTRRTRAGYEAAPSVINLSTVVFTRYVTTGERHLGDQSGVEGCITWSFTSTEQLTPYGYYRVIIGNFTPPGITSPGCLGHYATLGANWEAGIALLRVFGGTGPDRFAVERKD